MKKWIKSSRTGGFLALAALVVILPGLLPNSFYFEVAILALFNAAICVGLNLLIGYAGQISLGHAGFVGIGAYASAILTASFGWPAPVALAAGALATGALAFVVARPVLRLKGHYLAMATLGLGIIISIVINNEDQITGGPDGMMVPSFMIGSFELYGEYAWYWAAAGLLVAAVWLTLNLVDSPIGRGLKAVHGSEIAAQTCGVDTTRYKVIAFVVSAVFASIVGSLGAHYSEFVTPSDVGFFRSIELVTMVVLGGMASTYGAVVGAVLLTVLPQLLADFQEYEPMIFGLILMLTMIFMPRGLVPSLADVFRRRSKNGGEK